jgi:hypothetical protein
MIKKIKTVNRTKIANFMPQSSPVNLFGPAGLAHRLIFNLI